MAGRIYYVRLIGDHPRAGMSGILMRNGKGGHNFIKKKVGRRTVWAIKVAQTLETVWAQCNQYERIS